VRDYTAHTLSDDRMTLTIRRPAPGGWHVVTLNRQPQAGPFTDADIATALRFHAAGKMQPGQRNRTRRAETRFGTLWTHLMLGPPTWWLPKLCREKDGTVMAGWLRLAVAVKLERKPKGDGR
jgi:hypothetical protein